MEESVLRVLQLLSVDLLEPAVIASDHGYRRPHRRQRDRKDYMSASVCALMRTCV
jgi:hypothetical protein